MAQDLINGQPEKGAAYVIAEKVGADLRHRFTYHAPRADQLPRYSYLRALALHVAQVIVHNTPPGREQALSLTKLEESIMHANSAIARETVDEPYRIEG